MLQAYETWQDNPVLTSLHTTGLPISEIDFPAITICGQGSIYEVLNTYNHFRSKLHINAIMFQVSENVVNHQFHRYVESLGKDPMNLTDDEEKALRSDMMKDLYPGKIALIQGLYSALIRFIRNIDIITCRSF